MPFVDRALKGDPKNRRQTLPAQLTPDQQVTAQLTPSSMPRGRLSPSQFDALFAAAPVPRSVLGGKGGLPKGKRQIKRAGNPLPAHLASTPDISIPISATRSTLEKTGRQSAATHLLSDNVAGVSAKRQRVSLPLPRTVQQESQARRHSLAPARSRATMSATPVYIKPDPEDVVDELDLLASPATVLAAQQASMREPSPVAADTHAVLDSEHESLASSESGDGSAEVAASQLGGQAATRLEPEESEEQQQDEPELEPSMVKSVHTSPERINMERALASPVQTYQPEPTASRHASERHRTRSPSLRERSASIPVANSKDASEPLSFVRPHTPMRPVDDDVLLMFGLSPSIFQDKKPSRSKSPHERAQALDITPLTPDNLRMLQLSKSRTPKKQDAFVVNLPRTETSDATHPVKLNSFVSTVEDFAHQPVIVPVRPSSSRPTTAAQHPLAISKGQGAARQIEAGPLSQKSLPQQLRSELLSAAQLGDQDPPVSPQRRMRLELPSVTSPTILQACTPRAPALKQPNGMQRPPNYAAKKATKDLWTTPEPRPRILMDVPLQRSQPEQEVWPRRQKRKRSTPPPSPSMTPSISPQWRRKPRETKLVVEESPQSPATTPKLFTRPHTAPSPKNVARLDQSPGNSRSASSPAKKNPTVRPTSRQSRLQHLAQTLVKENKDADVEEEDHEEVRTPTQKLSVPPLRSSSARKRLSDDVLLDAMQDDDLVAQPSPARPQASLPKPKTASPRLVRVNVPAASPRTKIVAPRLSTTIVEDDLGMLDSDPSQIAQTNMQNDSELVKPAVRKKRGRPPSNGSQARPVNTPTALVPSELKGLKTFGLQPEALPRSKRQRRSPGAWWASTDQQPKEEEFEPSISRPGPARSRTVRSVSATAEPAVPSKAMKVLAATGQQSKRITTSSSVTARTVSFDFADDTPAAPKRLGQARKKPMKETTAKSGMQIKSTNSKQQMTTDKGPRLGKQPSDLDLLQSVTKKPAKGYRRTSRARIHAFDDEDSDDL